MYVPTLSLVNEALEAVSTAGRMAELSNELLGIEVRRARAAGATWGQIAERLGRARQTVQKRYATTLPLERRDATHPGKGTPTAGALGTRDLQMTCSSCGETKPGRKCPTVRRQIPGRPVREQRCRACRDLGRT
jgi:hypothetical protein